MCYKYYFCLNSLRTYTERMLRFSIVGRGNVYDVYNVRTATKFIMYELPQRNLYNFGYLSYG